jgi:hypothetical protein
MDDIFLVPGSKDPIKAGAIIYILGLVCSIFYFSQFNILSIDFLKPNAIIIGIYIWVYFVWVPRASLLGIRGMKRPKIYIEWALLFFFLMAIFNIGILLLLGNGIWNVIVEGCIISIVVLMYHTDFWKGRLTVTPSLLKSCSFGFIFCLLFAYFIFPKIPHQFAGGEPMEVKVFLKDSSLLYSRFTNRVRLLYESDKEYYFIEKIVDANTGILFQYTVKKINKSDVRKIEFTKSNWQPF